MRKLPLAFTILLLAALACGSGNTFPTPEHSIFDSGRTAYGFFPSPPEATLGSVFQLYKDMPAHADFVLLQQNTAWTEFVDSADGTSKTRTDIMNQVKLARANQLENVFVIDALNGLNRRDFIGLPAGWPANFGNPAVRSAYKNFALWIERTFHPRYLGLASEINTYMDAHPDDAANFVSLYKDIYTQIKSESPAAQVFVTFQWDDLNNMFPQPEEGNRQKFNVNWDEVEVFEPDLDVWAISTYPYFVFPSGTDIPADYYTPLLARTSKPLALGEGGFSSRSIGAMHDSEQDQTAFIQAVHDQLGPRLVFWVNTLLDDFNIDSYAAQMQKDGRDPKDAQNLANFGYIGLRNFDGSPKPALALWDGFRK